MPAVPRRAPFVLAAAGVVLALAACGSSGGRESSATSDRALRHHADERHPRRVGRHRPEALRRPGRAARLRHAGAEGEGRERSRSPWRTRPAAACPTRIAVEGNGVDKDGATVQPGGTSTVTVKLKPGTYTFYCPVDGHKAAGMKGTLTVS